MNSNAIIELNVAINGIIDDCTGFGVSSQHINIFNDSMNSSKK